MRNIQLLTSVTNVFGLLSALSRTELGHVGIAICISMNCFNNILCQPKVREANTCCVYKKSPQRYSFVTKTKISVSIDRCQILLKHKAVYICCNKASQVTSYVYVKRYASFIISTAMETPNTK